MQVYVNVHTHIYIYIYIGVSGSPERRIFLGSLERGSVTNSRFRPDPARPGPTGDFVPRSSPPVSADFDMFFVVFSSVFVLLVLFRPFWSFLVLFGNFSFHFSNILLFFVLFYPFWSFLVRFLVICGLFWS